MSLKSRLSSVLSSLVYGAFSLLPIVVRARFLDKVAMHVSLDYKDDIQLAVDSHWSYYRRISCAKEPDTIQWLENNLKEGDVFYDIGANVGAYGFVAASLIKEGVVVSVEPSFSTYKTLCNNIILNSKKFSGIKFYPFGCALGNADGYIEFKFSEIQSGAAQHGGSNFEASLNVPCLSLDDFISVLNIPSPTVMKIDVDGPEVLVLRGANAALASNSLRTVLIEVEDTTEDEVIKLLSSHKFFKSSIVRKGKWANIVFVRSI
jgi:FkbM family methyltransferase